MLLLLIQVTKALAIDDCPECCPVWLFELYNSRCPANRPDNALYLRPFGEGTIAKLCDSHFMSYIVERTLW